MNSCMYSHLSILARSKCSSPKIDLNLFQDDHKHNIKIINFADLEVVNYPIVKLIGTVEKETDDCQIIRLSNQSATSKTELIKNKFKILVELSEGNNELELSYCCESLKLSLKYQKRETDYSVLPLYIVCKGHQGLFQAPSTEDNSTESACRRITLISKLLQCITAEKLYEHHLGRKTFHLSGPCQIFNSSLPISEAKVMDQQELWECLAREIMSSNIGCEKTKFLAFLSCTEYRGDLYTESMVRHEELVKITKGYVALGGGGLALFGTACLYTWPEKFQDILTKFEDNRKVDRRKFLDDSCYRGTLGGCFSTTLGSALHELYHTFDLGHTSTGIMGRGFDNIQQVFTVNQESSSQDISKTFHSNIEFKEEFESEKLSERLQKENKRKEFNVIRKFDETDDTYMHKSCAVLLNYHK